MRRSDKGVSKSQSIGAGPWTWAEFLDLDVIKVYNSLRARPAVLCLRHNTFDPEAIPNNGTILIAKNKTDHLTVDQIQFFNHIRGDNQYS